MFGHMWSQLVTISVPADGHILHSFPQAAEPEQQHSLQVKGPKMEESGSDRGEHSCSEVNFLNIKWRDWHNLGFTCDKFASFDQDTIFLLDPKQSQRDTRKQNLPPY